MNAVVDRPLLLPEARASRAARPAQPAGAGPEGGREYLAFCVGDEEYAIDILQVQEIRGYTAPTRLAGAPAAVKGVMNLRGEIVPVADLRCVLGLPPADCDDSTVTIVLNTGAQVVGLVVDSVSDVLQLADDCIGAPPRLAPRGDAGPITGIATLDTEGTRRALVLLDVARLLAEAELLAVRTPTPQWAAPQAATAA